MQPILEMREITKTFPGVKALSDVNLAVMPAEIHAVVGENGAGKSTLMKVLAGVYSKDAGRILVKGKEVEIPNPRTAQQLGISIWLDDLSRSRITTGRSGKKWSKRGEFMPRS